MITAQDLYAFGNASGPTGGRLSDFGISTGTGVVGPFNPTGPQDQVGGASTYIDPLQAPLTGVYWQLAQGTALPPGLGVHADGVDVGGTAPWGHRTIYPTAAMTFDQFQTDVLNLPWVKKGRKK
jgi:hypothetical protein